MGNACGAGGRYVCGCSRSRSGDTQIGTYVGSSMSTESPIASFGVEGLHQHHPSSSSSSNDATLIKLQELDSNLDEGEGEVFDRYERQHNEH